MGYFANLYLVEVSKEEEFTKVKTTVYGGHVDGKRAYFSWGAGDRPENQLYSYADNTIFSDTLLTQLQGYPIVETYDFNKTFLLDASFTPEENTGPVVFHLILTEHYVPKRDEEIFEQPSEPTIDKLQENKLVITYAAEGKADLRFWITPIRKNESLDDYDITKLVRPDKPTTSKRVIGINLLGLKFEWHFEGK